MSLLGFHKTISAGERRTPYAWALREKSGVQMAERCMANIPHTRRPAGRNYGTPDTRYIKNHNRNDANTPQQIIELPSDNIPSEEGSVLNWD